MIKRLNTFITFAILIMAGNSFSQFKITSIQKSNQKPIQQSSRTEMEPLKLPFWDDFSLSYGLPDDTKWENSENVWIGTGIGINPPTLNSASFDGVDANGKPYSLDILSDGITDVLTSHKIDLSPYSVSDNIRLSFFYQIKGNGEIPNSNDSLRLEFLNSEGNWKKAWAVRGDESEVDTFLLRDIVVAENSYFHENFQFRFTSYGRQSGPFDNWNLDYIYLNRFDNRRDFPDRALSKRPTSFLKYYTSVPIQHFNENSTDILDNVKAEAFNLFDSLQPSSFTVIAKIQSLKADNTFEETIDTLAHEEFASFPDPLKSGERIVKMVSPRTINPTKINSDSLALIELKLFMNTDDNQPPDYRSIYSPLDFRINDTISSYQELSNYYAYDDGSAEFAAGLNFAGDMVAYRFPMKFDGTDTLVSVDMYFPNFNLIAGRNIEIMVWEELEDFDEEGIYSEIFTIRPGNQINDFVRYTFSASILVQDTFYLGWKQSSAGNIDIGLDKNTDSGDNIFFNLDGTWQQNTDTKGSLMMRPVFGKGAELVTAILPIEKKSISIYPNPGNGIYKVNGDFNSILIKDVLGKNVSFLQKGEIIDLQNNPKGIYIMVFTLDNHTVFRKVFYE